MYATGLNGTMISLPTGASDASLTDYHVGRAKLYIDQRFGGHKLINSEIMKSNIELTRFPVPNAEDRQGTHSCPPLVRASDLIGQLSPQLLKKNHLFIL
ncbi:hypothetical protein RintRC_6208 [Richelia intracellularis]|nr:hypothetical protein RintRC_6208 [Richelia intracellularis]